MKYEFEEAYNYMIRLKSVRNDPRIDTVWISPEYVGLFENYNELGFMVESAYFLDINLGDYREMLDALLKFMIEDGLNYKFTFSEQNKIARINGFLPVWYRPNRNWNKAFSFETGIVERKDFDAYYGGVVDYDEMVEKLKKFIVKEML